MRVFSLASFCVLFAAHAQAARLAVIGSPEFSAESTLLTASLGRHQGMEMVERDEIHKILAEQGLQALGEGDRTRIGSLLKADGLVLLEKAGDVLVLRLVDVEAGAMVKVLASPLPVSDPEAWSNLKAAEIARVAVNLPLRNKNSTPVSLLRINAAHGGSQGAALEESLNLLLAERLSENAGLVLLERWRLRDAVAEKDLVGAGGDFWNSSWVVDGAVTPSAAGFSLHLRLQPPGGKAAREITGKAPDLPALVEQANAEILAALQRPVTPWDPVAESARFIEEAQWAGANGLWDQAARAIEVAVALGDRKPDVLEWRWKCYDRLARNIPERVLPGGFRSEAKGAGPAAWQVLAMARSLLLCREHLANPGDSLRGRFKVYPRTLDGRERFGKGPVAEASALLASSGQLLRIFADRKSVPDAPRIEALQELRGATRQLFTEIIRVSPQLQFHPRSDDGIPPWDSKGDPRHRKFVEAGPQFEKNGGEYVSAPIERLESGRLWEETAEPYYAYVRQCLSAELPADPYFFQTVIHVVGRMAGAAAFYPKNPQGPEWREFAKSLAQEKNASLQVGAATILCRTGLPLEGIQIFETRREAVLKGIFPLEYLLNAFTTTETMNAVMERLGTGPVQNATGVLLKLVTNLLDEGLLPSRAMLEFLVSYKLSDRQAGALLAALRGPPPGILTQSSKEDWDKLAGFAFRSLAERAGESPAPRLQDSPPVPSPAPSPSRRSAASLPIPVDLAWVAKNHGNPTAPGDIRWAVPQGDQVWLQVEFGERGTSPVRRQFVVVDLPSMQGRIVHRDEAPDLSRVPFPREGPTFATDGVGVFFWNGKGICHAQGGEVRSLPVPDLVEPFLWLLDGRLYAADREGVLLQYDLAGGTHEILASQRRRPPQSSLDAEAGLDKVQRVFKTAEGSLAISMNGRVFQSRGNGSWEKEKESPMRQTVEQLSASLEGGWAEPRGTLSHRADLLLRQRASKESKDPMARMKPLGRYLGVAQDGPEKKPVPRVLIRAASVKDGVLWCFLDEPMQRRTLLFRLQLSTDDFVCRPLDFSPEFQAFGVQAGGNPDGLGGDGRLIPTEAGILLFAPGEPVLWFVPLSHITNVPIP